MSKANLLNRRQVVSSLLAARGDAIVVGGLGASTYDLAAAGDHARNLYLWGAMGSAVMIALGLALAQPELPAALYRPLQVAEWDCAIGWGVLRVAWCRNSQDIHNGGTDDARWYDARLDRHA